MELKEQGIPFIVAGKSANSDFNTSQVSEVNEYEENGEQEGETEEEMFPYLQPKDIDGAFKMKDSLKSKSKEEKREYLFKVLKVKKHPGPSLAKQSYCPVYECSDKFNNNKNLRQHIIKKHPRLSEFGVELMDNGELSWPEELLDYSLMLSKLYPSFVKRIINLSKKIDKGR